MIVIVRSLSFVFHMFRSLIVAPLYLGNDDQADLTKCEASFNPKAPMSMPQCLYHRQLQFWVGSDEIDFYRDISKIFFFVEVGTLT